MIKSFPFRVAARIAAINGPAAVTLFTPARITASTAGVAQAEAIHVINRAIACECINVEATAVLRGIAAEPPSLGGIIKALTGAWQEQCER
jgi:hypothetical protein